MVDVRFRPEEVDQLFAGEGVVSVEGKLGEKNGRLLGAESRDDAIPLHCAQSSEHLDFPGSVEHPL